MLDRFHEENLERRSIAPKKIADRDILARPARPRLIPLPRDSSCGITTYRDIRSVSGERAHGPPTNRDSGSYRDQSSEFPAFGCDCEHAGGGVVRRCESGVESQRRGSGTKDRQSERAMCRAICREFPGFVSTDRKSASYLRFPLVSECRLGPMARRNADCRCRCVVFQGVGYAPRGTYVRTRTDA
jgi:hypothetical protein